ncbi:DUF3592 domain-containing protein [Kitasatospora sp. NPDC049285]|uniref:DUF3592 domain-containing protein n=1 Tax=Kitasatospora sp. NPDC049285 TaxID=3157096 RepID=UPI00341A71C2
MSAVQAASVLGALAVLSLGWTVRSYLVLRALLARGLEVKGVCTRQHLEDEHYVSEVTYTFEGREFTHTDHTPVSGSPMTVGHRYALRCDPRHPRRAFLVDRGRWTSTLAGPLCTALTSGFAVLLLAGPAPTG